MYSKTCTNVAGEHIWTIVFQPPLLRAFSAIFEKPAIFVGEMLDNWTMSWYNTSVWGRPPFLARFQYEHKQTAD
jgi:hypothetical protein